KIVSGSARASLRSVATYQSMQSQDCPRVMRLSHAGIRVVVRSPFAMQVSFPVTWIARIMAADWKRLLRAGAEGGKAAAWPGSSARAGFVAGGSHQEDDRAGRVLGRTCRQ